jgi:hypothetical protein
MSCAKLEKPNWQPIDLSWLQEQVAPSQIVGLKGNALGGPTTKEFLALVQPGDTIWHYRAPKDYKLSEDYAQSVEGYVLIRQCTIISTLSTQEAMIANIFG